jgi:hypothetical protein
MGRNSGLGTDPARPDGGKFNMHILLRRFAQHESPVLFRTFSVDSWPTWEQSLSKNNIDNLHETAPDIKGKFAWTPAAIQGGIQSRAGLFKRLPPRERSTFEIAGGTFTSLAQIGDRMWHVFTFMI